MKKIVFSEKFSNTIKNSHSNFPPVGIVLIFISIVIVIDKGKCMDAYS